MEVQGKTVQKRLHTRQAYKLVLEEPMSKRWTHEYQVLGQLVNDVNKVNFTATKKLEFLSISK